MLDEPSSLKQSNIEINKIKHQNSIKNPFFKKKLNLDLKFSSKLNGSVISDHANYSKMDMKKSIDYNNAKFIKQQYKSFNRV
jgi:hypothetical protein